MAAWPEFYFDSEFESASEYSTHTSAAVQLSMWRDPSTNSYRRHVQSQPQGANHRHSQGNQPHNGEKRQPLIVGVQSKPPDAYQHRDQPNRQPPCQPAKKNQPPKMQPPAANGIQVQSAKSQHLNSGVKPPDVDMQKQPPNTLVKSRSQRQPHNGIRSQPSAANFQNQPPDLPPDPDPEMRVIKEDWG